MKQSVLTVDSKRYGRLLARKLPAVIRTEEENERLIAELQNLDDRYDELTPRNANKRLYFHTIAGDVGMETNEGLVPGGGREMAMRKARDGALVPPNSGYSSRTLGIRGFKSGND
jgi:hypothetical protein